MVGVTQQKKEEEKEEAECVHCTRKKEEERVGVDLAEWIGVCALRGGDRRSAADTWQSAGLPRPIISSQNYSWKKKFLKNGLNRDLNPGPLAPKARIIPLDHWASWFESLSYCGSFELCVISNIAEIILCISAFHSHISKLRYDYSFILNTHTAEMHSNNNGQDSIPAKITYSELISIFKVTTKAPYLEKIWFWWI